MTERIIRMNEPRRAISVIDEDSALAGLAAVRDALHPQPGGTWLPDLETAASDRLKADAEAQRQRDLDAALAEVVELVTRHRARLGRKTCSHHDGGIIRRIFDLLRSMSPGPEAPPLE
jgi:hypothetical protein